MQVDIAALHAALPFFVAPAGAAAAGAGAEAYAGAAALEDLLHEAALSAAERCVDDAASNAGADVSMAPAVLYSLVTARLASLSLVA